MANLRLTAYARSTLRDLALKLVNCPAERQALESAYVIASRAIRAAAEAKYPPRDMAVLKKYEKAGIDDCIRISVDPGKISRFTFKDGTGPLMPDCKIIILSDTQLASFLDWVDAGTALGTAEKIKLGDYYSLIASARTLEQVVEVWPEAERVRSDIGGNAISVLSDDVLDRIRADVAVRQGAAA